MNDQSLRAASRQSLPPEVQEGALLGGRYRMGRMLGAGGMGAVLAAEHVELNEPVAIKVLLRDAAAQASPEALGRFTREAWAASKIKSEYVARVSDLGRLADGTPYIVMEYLDGVDLEGLLRAQGQLELEQALELLLQACEALAEAHALGIFHRDLKPSNLFCIRRSDGVMAIKLLDFGISKIAPAAASFADQRLTGTASTLGTPLYMSPEQMRSGRVADERSDIWALGVILYETLLGRVPFEAENLADLAVRIATEKPAPISLERADVPAGLEQVIMRCLEKDSAKRFQTVAELARALAAFVPPRAAAHAERAERILMAQSARSAPVISTTRSTAPTANGRGSHARLRTDKVDTLSVKRRAPQTIVVAVGLTVLLLAVASALLWRRSTQPPSAAGSPTAAETERDETRSNAALTPPSSRPSGPHTRPGEPPSAAPRTNSNARRESRTSEDNRPPSAAQPSAVERGDLPTGASTTSPPAAHPSAAQHGDLPTGASNTPPPAARPNTVRRDDLPIGASTTPPSAAHPSATQHSDLPNRASAAPPPAAHPIAVQHSDLPNRASAAPPTAVASPSARRPAHAAEHAEPARAEPVRANDAAAARSVAASANATRPAPADRAAPRERPASAQTKGRAADAAKPPPSAATSPEERTPTGDKAARPNKAPPSTRKDSELDSLGGRL